MNYDDDTLKKINDNADLLSYVEQKLTLEQRGNDFFAHCPLHTDNTPSLSFTPAKNSYYCFSCGKSGGMIGYLMDFENLNFEDAVIKASKIANIDVNKMCRSKTISFLRKWQKVILSQKKENKEEHNILPNSTMDKFIKEPITEWLSENIEQRVMDIFDIRADRISNRIIYPVYDIEGNLINIKGRTRYSNYKELKIPKYINYYPVGKMDYFQCLEKTLPFIKEKSEVIIFESIKSVMKAYGWGYKNCVSAEKHTLTQEQIFILSKLQTDVVLAYDSDITYEEKEIKRNIEKLRKITNVYIIDDFDNLLGGVEAKNSPADCGKEIWETLYFNKRKVI